MDWARYFRFSITDLAGLFSRRTLILSLMAVLLYQTIGILYGALTLQLLRMTPPSPVEIRAERQSVPEREPAGAYAVISERNIFGTSTRSIEETQTLNKPPEQPDVATLFDLRGTVAGTGKYAFAVMEEKGSRKQKLVKIGDVLSGATIVRINRNSLVLTIDGQERTLKTAEKTDAPIVPPPPGRVQPAAGGATGGTMTISRGEISAALADMGTMLRQAQVRPYFKAGVPEGFIITNIQPGSLYQRMGIANGDILQGVDGRRIQTADDMMAFLNTLKGSSGMAVSLQRGGRQQMLNYQFR